MNWYFYILWTKDYRGQWAWAAQQGPLWLTGGNAEAHAWYMRENNNDWSHIMTVYKWNGSVWVQIYDPGNWGRNTTQ